MEDAVSSSSQANIVTLPSQDPLLDLENSSPVPARKNSARKPKAQPTVTPRTFTRFFTPRSSLTRGGKIGASRQALKDITASAARNRNGSGRRRSPKKDSIIIYADEDETGSAIQPRKKRKTEPQNPATIYSDGSSPLKRLSTPLHECCASSDAEHDIGLSEDERDSDTEATPSAATSTWPVVRSQSRTVNGLLSRELGIGGHNQRPLCNGLDWQHETADFYSTPKDSHICDNPNDPAKSTLPFCSVGCNTNSLIAIGDEEGGVRLLETFQDGRPEFCRTYLAFRPHTNAVMDLAFSPDDSLLATAAGDQTSQIIDMPSQRAIYTLVAHEATVKQIRFQPGNPSVIATSSRDGSVRLWDLRCKGSDTPVRELRMSLDGPADSQSSRAPPRKMTFARCVDAIMDAHLYRGHPSLAVSSAAFADETYDIPTKNQTSTKHGYHSVTSLDFLPSGREHLLLTASEANASVRLWDLRTTHSHRRSTNTVPLSSTRQPDSHTTHRVFGITSLALSTDSARLYAYCRDNTIYAYSTNHLILGHAPELSSTAQNSHTNPSFRKSRFSRTTEKQGLGPIYGFRHPLFHATSFYVKVAVRPARDGNTELLAAGSSDGCAVLWPTDERYMRNNRRDSPASSFPSFTSSLSSPAAAPPQNPYATPPSSAPSSSRPTLPRTTSHVRLNDTVPIYTHGTPLIRGHEREVTGLSWAHGGELVTVSDDCTARCWREGRKGGEEARNLRRGGEGEGRRWDCGWADVGEGWDEED